MAESPNPWLALAADERLWPGALAREQRIEILQELSTGSIAVPTTASGSSPVFHEYSLNGKNFLVPHRHKQLLDFFLRAGDAEQGAAQGDALRILGDKKHLLLTGGPGTGKSHTLSAFVTGLSPIDGRPARVAIAAPTGKAAARFSHLKGAGNAFVECYTLHRLLGISSDERYFRYTDQNPLPWDILIVDEISMLDLGLFAAVVRALPVAAQLVLAGDLDQLPAVDGLPIDRAIRFLSSLNIINHVHLTEVQRFSKEKANAYRIIADTGIQALDNPAVSAVVGRIPLRGAAALAEYTDHYAREKLCSDDATKLRKAFNDLKPGSHPPPDLVKTAFDFLKGQVLLSERREGPYGSLAINRRIAAEVARVSHSENRTLEPVMNTINNYDLELYNGDVGFVWENNNERRIIFRTSDGGFRVLALNALSGQETAYAMTIHKSQGSEYDDVFVIYEQGQGRTDHRLLYTAVTRAKRDAQILEIMK